jgi:hypothetical protein
MNKLLFTLGALLGLVLIAPPVQATILVPGAPPVPVSPLNALPAGSIVSNGGTASTVSFTAVNSTGHVALIATLYFAVYKEAATGFLDFLYQVQSKKGGKDALALTLNSNFKPASFYLDASYLRSSAPVPSGFLRVKTGETPPTTASLSADATTATFKFGTPFGPGSTSNVFLLGTHNLGFTRGTTTLVTRGTTTTITTFAPSPEPSTLLLFAGCFLGLAGWAGWRRWKGESLFA